MQEPAPKRIPNQENHNIVHLPTQEHQWRAEVAKHTQQTTGSLFTIEQATPAGTHAVPNSPELQEAGAKILDKEPDFNSADVGHLYEIGQNYVTGKGSIWRRISDAAKGLKIGRRRAEQLANIGSKGDPDKLDIAA